MIVSEGQAGPQPVFAQVTNGVFATMLADTALSYPAKTTNCALNFISARWALDHFGYTHYHVEMSKLIREGLLTRAEALEQLRADFDPALLNRIAEPLGFRFPERP